MGSSVSQKSDEELANEAKARQEIAASIQSRKKVITGGTTKGGSRDEYAGTEVIMDPDGKSFTFGSVASDPSSKFKWNEKTGDYRSNGGGILQVADLAPAEQSSSGGGGGGGGSGNPKPKPGHGDPVTITDPFDTIIPGTGGILADQGMVNWNPISSNGNGGAGLNPLVDPNEWLVQLPELNMGKQTRTWIPNKGFYGGLI